MKKQKSRQEMFEQIQDLQRELAEGAWENVDLRHQYMKLHEKYTAVKSFIEGNLLEISVGMSIGPDSPPILAEKTIASIRSEFKKIHEQNKE